MCVVCCFFFKEKAGIEDLVGLGGPGDWNRSRHQHPAARGAEAVEVRLGERRFRVPSEFAACAVGLDRKGNLGLLAVDEEEGDPSV